MWVRFEKEGTGFKIHRDPVENVFWFDESRMANENVTIVGERSPMRKNRGGSAEATW